MSILRVVESVGEAKLRSRNKKPMQDRPDREHRPLRRSVKIHLGGETGCTTEQSRFPYAFEIVFLNDSHNLSC